jgi:hypothetical protein
MKADFTILLALVALAVGLVILFCRYGGGGGGNGDYAVPTSRAPQGGGYLPGYTRNGLRNGGSGGTQPIVSFPIETVGLAS